MTLVEPGPELAALLREYASVGGVVEWAAFDLRPPEKLDLEAHRRVAAATVREAIRRANPVLEFEGNDIPADAMPTRVSGREFFGPLWAPSREVLILRGQSAPFVNAWFYADDEENSRNALDHVAWAPRLNTGYAYAFGCPPYGLRCPNRRASELFVSINRRMFPHKLTESNVTIYEWPTNWSTYFDAGHEWWGCFLWTVAWPGWRVVAVTASTTD